MMTDEEYINMIKDCSELDLFLTIDALGMFVWRMTHDLSHGRIDGTEEELEGVRADIKSMQERLEKTVPFCERFGVDFEIVEKKNELTGGAYKTACDEYWQWYRHWDDWKKNLTDDEWQEFQRLHQADEPYEHLLPDGNWQESSKDSEEST